MDETPRSFVNAMEGAAIRSEREHDRATAQAWNTAKFVLGMYSGGLKGRKLSDFLIGERDERKTGASQAIAFFHAMRAKGLPVTIERVNG